VDGLGEPAGEGPGAHRESSFGDEFSPGGPDGGHADDFHEGLALQDRSGGSDELDEAGCLTSRTPPVGLCQRHQRHPCSLAVPGVGLLFAEPGSTAPILGGL